MAMTNELKKNKRKRKSEIGNHTKVERGIDGGRQKQTSIESSFLLLF
jgi:hypothetical protein